LEVKRLKQKLVGIPQDVDCITLILEIKDIILMVFAFTLFDKIRNGTDKIENEEPIIKLEH
jgi:hypothetical protein